MNTKLTSVIERLVLALILGCVLLSPAAAQTVEDVQATVTESEPMMMPEVLTTAETDAAIMLPPVVVTATRVTEPSEAARNAPAQVEPPQSAAGGGAGGGSTASPYCLNPIHGSVGGRLPRVHSLAEPFPELLD